ncbi:mCG1025565, partial [Mus musculus]
LRTHTGSREPSGRLSSDPPCMLCMCIATTPERHMHIQYQVVFILLMSVCVFWGILGHQACKAFYPLSHFPCFIFCETGSHITYLGWPQICCLAENVLELFTLFK